MTQLKVEPTIYLQSLCPVVCLQWPTSPHSSLLCLGDESKQNQSSLSAEVTLLHRLLLVNLNDFSFSIFFFDNSAEVSLSAQRTNQVWQLATHYSDKHRMKNTLDHDTQSQVPHVNRLSYRCAADREHLSEMGREALYCEMSGGDDVASDLVGWLNTEELRPKRKLVGQHVRPILQLRCVRRHRCWWPPQCSKQSVI